MQIEAGSVSFTVYATLQKYWRGIVAKKSYKKHNMFWKEKTNFANLYMNFAVSENFAINMLLFKYKVRRTEMYLKKGEVSNET